MNSHTWKKALMALVGVIIIALGATILKEGKVGLDPFTAMNIGISDKLGWSLGVYQLLINLIILVVVFFLNKHYIGIGTLINMVVVGFLIDSFSTLYVNHLSFNYSFSIKAIHLILGVLLFTFGASMYMSADLGTAPYDAIAPIISQRANLSYQITRICQDVIVVIIAFVFGGPIGIGTVINAFFTGPLINFWNENVNKPLANKL